MTGRKRLLWLAAALTALSFLVPASASALSGPTACNGAIELCDKPFNEVVLPGTHNSMSNEEYGWVLPNQFVSIPSQLKAGVRGFLVDVYYGQPNGSDQIKSVPKNVGHANGDAMYLCHTMCEWGSSDLVQELAKISSFLAVNPREVLMFVVEDKVHPDDFAKAVTESGLIDYIYTGSTESYPTLTEMISSNQRVVMLAEQDSGSVPWYHRAYSGPMQETPYDFRRDEAGTVLNTQQAIGQLTDPASLDSSCRPHRGGSNGALFLMNHWVNGLYDNLGTTGDVFSPDPRVASILNTKEVLVNRARACQQRRGILPSIIAVDMVAEADGLLAAVDELNEVTPDPDPEPEPKGIRLRIKAQKKVRTTAGTRAAFRVNVTNTGDRRGRVRVCAKVPAKLARKLKCLVRNVRPGTRAALTFKVRTRPRARGRGKVRFIATAAGKSVRTTSNLIVRARKRR